MASAISGLIIVLLAIAIAPSLGAVDRLVTASFAGIESHCFGETRKETPGSTLKRILPWPNALRIHYESKTVFYTSWQNGAKTGSLSSLRLNDSVVSTVWAPPNSGNVYGLAIDQSRHHVYFNSLGNLYRYNIDTEQVETVVEDIDKSSYMAIDEENSYLFMSRGLFTENLIRRCNLLNSTCEDFITQVVSSGNSEISSLAWNAGNLYMTEKGGGDARIRKAPAQKGASFSNFLTIPFVDNKYKESTDRADPNDLVITEDYIYYSCFVGCKGDVNRVPLQDSVTSDDIEGMEVVESPNALEFVEKTNDDCAPAPDDEESGASSWTTPMNLLFGTLCVVLLLILR